MKQDHNRDPRQEAEPIRVNHLRRAVYNIDSALAMITDVFDDVATGTIRDMHTFEHPFKHILNAPDHEPAQTEASIVAESVNAREQMEAEAREQLAQINTENDDFMKLLHQAQTEQELSDAA